MLCPADIIAAAQDLDTAEKSRVQTRQFSQRFPGMTLDDAYAVQEAWVEMKLAAGRRVIGHKIGLTSKAMQAALNIDTPDSGVLLDDMLFADGGTIPSERFIGTRIEVELAFIIRSRLEGPACTIADVLNATEFVAPAFEILDTRIERVDPHSKTTRIIVDTVSDNAANAGLVMGRQPFRQVEADLRWVGAIVTRNGVVEETGLAAGVLNHPAASVAWLARRLSQQGKALEPGQIVLSGSFIRPIEARRGDSFCADYGPFGTVSCHFG